MAVQAKFITWPPTVHPSTISSLHNARWVLIHQPLTERELICSSSCKNEKTCIVVLPRWAIGKSLVEGRSITLFRICCRIAVIHVKDNFFMFHLYTNKRLEAWEQLERSNSKGARWHNWITELRKESSIPFSAFCLANLLSDFSPSPWRFLKSQTLKIWESKKGPFLYLYKGVHQTTRKFPPPPPFSLTLSLPIIWQLLLILDSRKNKFQRDRSKIHQRKENGGGKIELLPSLGTVSCDVDEHAVKWVWCWGELGNHGNPPAATREGG